MSECETIEGPFLPARCESCGLTFRAAGFEWLGAANVVVENCIDQCPRCGGDARVVSGEVASNGRKLRVKPASGFDRETLRQLSKVAKNVRAKGTKISTEEILAEVADVSPELAAKLRTKGLTSAFLILVLFWLIKSVNLNVTVDVNRLVDQAIEAVHGKAPVVIAPPSVSPTPVPSPEFKEVRSLPAREVARLEDRRSRRFQRRELVRSTTPRPGRDPQDGEA